MRRVILLVALALALPIAAAASSIGVTAEGGTITDNSTTNTLSLSGDVITKYGTTTGTNLGTVTFTTSAFAMGGVGGGMFGPGGTFTITPTVSGATVFSGTFVSGSWTKSTTTGAYSFVGDVMGNSGGGALVSVVTATGTLGANGSIDVNSVDITLNTSPVPEPGTLSLLGTGLVAIGSLLRKRFFR